MCSLVREEIVISTPRRPSREGGLVVVGHIGRARGDGSHWTCPITFPEVGKAENVINIVPLLLPHFPSSRMCVPRRVPLAAKPRPLLPARGWPAPRALPALARQDRRVRARAGVPRTKRTPSLSVAKGHPYPCSIMTRIRMRALLHARTHARARRRDCHKIGIIYVKQGQVSQREIFRVRDSWPLSRPSLPLSPSLPPPFVILCDSRGLPLLL